MFHIEKPFAAEPAPRGPPGPSQKRIPTFLQLDPKLPKRYSAKYRSMELARHPDTLTDPRTKKREQHKLMEAKKLHLNDMPYFEDPNKPLNKGPILTESAKPENLLPTSFKDFVPPDVLATVQRFDEMKQEIREARHSYERKIENNQKEKENKRVEAAKKKALAVKEKMKKKEMEEKENFHRIVNMMHGRAPSDNGDGVADRKGKTSGTPRSQATARSSRLADDETIRSFLSSLRPGERAELKIAQEAERDKLLERYRQRMHHDTQQRIFPSAVTWIEVEDALMGKRRKPERCNLERRPSSATARSESTNITHRLNGANTQRSQDTSEEGAGQGMLDGEWEWEIRSEMSTVTSRLTPPEPASTKTTPRTMGGLASNARDARATKQSQPAARERLQPAIPRGRGGMMARVPPRPKSAGRIQRKSMEKAMAIAQRPPSPRVKLSARNQGHRQTPRGAAASPRGLLARSPSPRRSTMPRPKSAGATRNYTPRTEARVDGSLMTVTGLGGGAPPISLPPEVTVETPRAIECKTRDIQIRPKSAGVTRGKPLLDTSDKKAFPPGRFLETSYNTNMVKYDPESFGPPMSKSSNQYFDDYFQHLMDTRPPTERINRSENVMRAMEFWRP